MPHRKNRIFPHRPDTHHAENAPFRQPQFECRNRKSVVDLEVFVPGVDENGVDLQLEARRLVVTACKASPVVSNWQAANLGAAQRDYQLRLRLPSWVKRDKISADLEEGVLRIHLPKSGSGAPADIRVA